MQRKKTLNLEQYKTKVMFCIALYFKLEYCSLDLFSIDMQLILFKYITRKSKSGNYKSST